MKYLFTHAQFLRKLYSLIFVPNIVEKRKKLFLYDLPAKKEKINK